jgi:hypothetical protein
VEVIRIEGVWFKLEDAREFAERVLIYGEANDPQPDGRGVLARLSDREMHQR